MINLYPLNIEELIVHKVGNRSKNEPLFLSKKNIPVSDELLPLLKTYFFKPFQDKEVTYYRFFNEADLAFNHLYNIANDIFENPDSLQENSQKIARHLYDQSQHPHIKTGELYVCYLTDCILNNETVDAIGIFKSELKHNFLQFEENEESLDFLLQQGVNLNKLDKGCLIFNAKKEEGYKLLSIDSNRYDTRYWMEHFLGIEVFEDENFYTKKYLKLCKDFAKDVILPAEDKKEEVLFMNKSVDFFAKNDDFEESKFLNEVVENPALIPEFKVYKEQKTPEHVIENLNNFPIANNAVSAVRKKTKNVIDLDTNVQIKLNFVNTDSAEKFLEKGWDEERQMYYYLVYFNEEIKK